MTLRPGYGRRLKAAEELLARSSPVGRVESEWPAGKVCLTAYLGAAEFPEEIQHRVRCLVTRDSEVLVIWDAFGVADCFPGGGAEYGESVTDTACREVLEETGWHINGSTIRVVGWIHVYSYAEPSPDHPFPHPDAFMTVVHANPLRAAHGHEEWTDVEGFVTKSAFVPIDQLPDTIRTSPIHAPFLELAFGTGQ